MLTNTPNCSTLRLYDCWTPTRLCEQLVVAGVVSTITVRKKIYMPNSYVVDSSVGTVGLFFNQTINTYLSACSAARDSILRSRADRIKCELDEVSGDIGATWRTAQRLLHSKHKTVCMTTLSAKPVCRRSASSSSRRSTA